MRTEVESLTDSAVRVNIPGWKAGRSLTTLQILEKSPTIIDWYLSFADNISLITGLTVKPTPLALPTSCALLVYDEEGDFINWHYDVNYFSGRFFTVIIPVTVDSTCTSFKYIDPQGIEQSLEGMNIVFEGEKVFHTATKLCKNQKRVVLSLQYVTDDASVGWKKMLMNIKDFAYTGF